jgi:hypothetical protein
MELPSRASAGISTSLAVLAATAAVAGCGGGSASAGSPASAKPAPPTNGASTASPAPRPSAKDPAEARFAASAGTICKRVNAELTVVKPKRASVAEVLRRVPANAATEQKGAADLSALEPPVALAHDWRLIVAYRRTLANELAQLAHAARKKDTKRIAVLSASKLHERRLLLMTARRAGLAVCGTVG